jgi:hypothetical protein
MNRQVAVLAEAATDIEHAIDFYDGIEPGLGAYFRDSIMSDMRRLGLHFGTHAVHFGLHRALSHRFPFAIYYRDRNDRREVIAILDLRRNPSWLKRQLGARDA